MRTLTLKERQKQLKKQVSGLNRKIKEVEDKISRGGKYLYIGKYLLHKRDGEKIYIHITGVIKGRVIHESIQILDDFDYWLYQGKVDLSFLKDCKEISKRDYDKEDKIFWEIWDTKDDF